MHHGACRSPCDAAVTLSAAARRAATPSLNHERRCADQDMYDTRHGRHHFCPGGFAVPGSGDERSTGAEHVMSAICRRRRWPALRACDHGVVWIAGHPNRRRGYGTSWRNPPDVGAPHHAGRAARALAPPGPRLPRLTHVRPASGDRTGNAARLGRSVHTDRGKAPGQDVGAICSGGRRCAHHPMNARVRQCCRSAPSRASSPPRSRDRQRA